MTTSLIRLYHTCKPVALYTYETAHAQNIIIKINHTVELEHFVSQLVTEHFGIKHIDNKITIECELLLDTADLKQKQLVYLTWWDGILYLGLSARFDKDFIIQGNEWRKVLAKHLIKT